MAIRDLIPWGHARNLAPNTGATHEASLFIALHREMNRLFDDVFERFELARAPGLFGSSATWPRVEVKTSENEVTVAAELPGMEEKDVELLVNDDVLTIKGERKTEREDQARGFSEHFYGRFERSIALPFEVQQDKADASFSNGMLTVKLPRSATQQSAKRIPINSAGATAH